MLQTLLAVLLALQAAAPQPKFDSGRAWEHLRQLVAIGPRPAGSAAIEQTRKYIKSKLEAEGVVVVEQAWVERGLPDRDGAGAQGAAEWDDDRARVPRRRRGAPVGVAGHRQYLRQPPLRRDRATRRIARHAEGDGPRRHDRRSRSGGQA